MALMPLNQRAVETLRFCAQQFPNRQPEHYVFPLEKYRCAGAEESFGFTGTLVYETDRGLPGQWQRWPRDMGTSQ